MGLRTLFVVVATFLLVVLATTTARADAIPADLTITGTIDFDTGFAVGNPAGAMVVKVGGTDTTSTVSGGAVTAGTNPLSGTFSSWGDGVGIQSLTGSASTSGEEWAAGFDITLTFTNTSATDSYDVVVKVAYDNRVDSSGDDAYADSEFTLDDDDGAEVFFTQLVTDTVNGDEKNGTPQGSFGAALTDAGTWTYALTLAPGASFSWTGDYTVEGGAYTSGDLADSFFDVFVEIELGPAIPEPGTFILLGLGLAGVALAMRRRT